MAVLYLTLLGGKEGAGNCNDLKTLCRHNLKKYGSSSKDNRERTGGAT
jgi:hypothetical protein